MPAGLLRLPAPTIFLWGLGFLLLLVHAVLGNSYLNQGYPPCTSLAFDGTGYPRLDLSTMLYNCSKNIPGSMVIPSFYSYSDDPNQPLYRPLNVTIGIVINNLIAVNDVTTQVQMDFWYRNIWQDPRWYLPPETLSYLNPITLIEGLDITEYVTQASNPLNIWLPDIVFYEGVELNELASMLKLFPNGTLFWSRHYSVVISEAQMNLLQYPLDSQNFSLTFQSYAYCANLLLIDFFPSPISFNYDEQQHVNYVDLNQLWSYDYYTAYSIVVPSPVIFNPDRTYSTAYMNLQFTRQAFGVTYRLGLPIAMFLVLVGFSFWADIEKRIDVTLQMLLVVAALYLVIGQIIPMVGYFTRMDLYITTAFLILVLTTGIHFSTLLLERKVHKYPVNAFLRDLLVFFFRVIWVPMSLLVFICFFDVKETGILIAIVVASILSASNAYLNRKYLKQSFKIAILNLREKERAIQEAMKATERKDDVTRTSTIDADGKNEESFKRKIKQLTWFEVYLLQKTRTKYLGRISKMRTEDARLRTMNLMQNRHDSVPAFNPSLAMVEVEMGPIDPNNSRPIESNTAVNDPPVKPQQQLQQQQQSFRGVNRNRSTQQQNNRSMQSANPQEFSATRSPFPFDPFDSDDEEEE